MQKLKELNRINNYHPVELFWADKSVELFPMVITKIIRYQSLVVSTLGDLVKTQVMWKRHTSKLRM
jgi:hypothetical protein